MNIRKLSVLLYILALVAGACGSTDVTTTDAPANTTSSPGTTTTAAVPLPYPDPVGDTNCVVTNLVTFDTFVTQAQLNNAFAFTDDEPNALLLTASNIASWGEAQIDSSAAEAVAARTPYVDVTNLIARQAATSDPAVNDPAGITSEHVLSVVEAMETILGIDVRPVYPTSLESGHWSFEPGADDYETFGGASFGVLQTKGSSGPVVAIVDSGFPFDGSESTEALNVGLDPKDAWDFTIREIDGVERLVIEPIDFTNNGIPSHGAFVTSLVASIAPNARIFGSRPETVIKQVTHPGGTVEFRSGSRPTVDFGYALDEFAVDIAIERLAMGLGDDSIILNLSLGYEPCNGQEPQRISDTIEAWQAKGNGLEIFAAAGNHISERAFYPAAFSTVVGVAADDANPPTGSNDSVVTWNESDVRVHSGMPISADIAVIGADLVGLGLLSGGIWSGSSFAAAVASGIAAAGSSLAWNQAQRPSGAASGWWKGNAAVPGIGQTCQWPVVAPMDVNGARHVTCVVVAP